jgi:carotenoid cleavage dioxygenase-like enzyme
MKFPETPSFTGFFAPSGVEADVKHLPVIQGEVPADIAGSFYRVHPDPQFPPLYGDDIWFNGDGMVTRFSFRDGNVRLQQKWARTPKFVKEREAGHALFGAYRNPLTDTEEVKGEIRGTANTNVIAFGGKLLALKEDSPPVLMDAETLETIEPIYTFNGQLISETFTAHPKIDPRTGNMLAFSYAAKGLLTRDMVFYEITPDHEVIKAIEFQIPYYCMMHDWGITEDYAVFHVVPSTSDWDRLEKRLPHFGFDKRKPIHLGVLPREGAAEDIRWFSAPNCFASHVVNAHNVGTIVHFDTPMAEGNMFPFFPDYEGAPFEPAKAQSRVTRWTIDMLGNSDEIGMERKTELVGEFPRIDDRFAGLKKPIWLAAIAGFHQAVRNAGGAIGRGHADEHDRADRSGNRRERQLLDRPGLVDAGALLHPARRLDAGGRRLHHPARNRLAEMGSRLLLFAALDLAQGPIATIQLPFRIRSGLHGNWTPEAAIAA